MMRGAGGVLPQSSHLAIHASTAAATLPKKPNSSIDEKMTQTPLPVPKSVLPRPSTKGGMEGKFGPNWDGMWIADPKTADTNPMGVMVPSLMEDVVKYGELCQVTYDNFTHFGNGLPHRANPKDLLEDQNLKWIKPSSHVYDYSIEADKGFYLTATSGIYPGQEGFFDPGNETTNWIGYIAVSKPLPMGPLKESKRDIAIVFRGTQAKTEWVSDIIWELQPWDETDKSPNPVGVAKGFEGIYRRFASTPGDTLSIQGQVHVALSRLLTKYPDVGSITTTGHSLGGALASMCAFDIAWSQINRVGYNPDGDLIPVTAITFEAPRVGNAAYSAAFEEDYSPDHHPASLHHVSYLKMLRIVNIPDIVPKEPSVPFKRQLPGFLGKTLSWLVRSIAAVLTPGDGDQADGYVHGGTEYKVDSQPLEAKGIIPDYRSDFLVTDLKDKIGQFHDLQLALYLIDQSRPIGPAAKKEQEDTAAVSTH
ncbi:Phospholipase A1-II 5 [Coccomyxa sp. Obi]|nr:Phospholipase A1-II 5 [Coccomyxa sp. Obi]